MNSIADGSVIVQTFSQSAPSTPPWFGEVALMAQHLHRHRILSAISERVRFARRRFGRYEVIDFLAVLFGYAERRRTHAWRAFYHHLQPFAPAFMALFGRERLPDRSTLSRFLSSLNQTTVEALRTLFLDDLLARPLNKEKQIGGLVDRAGRDWIIFDIDGTREAARQRALPKTPNLPALHRRLESLCAPGYTGRKRGEIVRTRTTIVQAHTSQWLGSLANPGNGLYREELRRAVAMIGRYCKVHGLPVERVLLRLDGLYGTGAVLADLENFSCVTRGKDYSVLDQTEVQARLHLPPDQQFSRPESELVRTLYDCPDVSVGSSGQRCRVVVATHPANGQKSRIGLTRAGLVYELFLTRLPQDAFTAADVLALYLHRGAFEPLLADEDQEQDPDRWCSHSPCGQETWQIVSQWVWNLRLELGHQLDPTPLRTTLFAAAAPKAEEQQILSSGYGPPTIALPWKAGRLSGRDFVLESDGTLRCPAKQSLSATEQRHEADGSLRLVYAAKMKQCRPCLLREQCQWHGHATTKPRRVSLLLHPLQVGPDPLLWKDWSRRQHRRACRDLTRLQRVEVTLPLTTPAEPQDQPVLLSRAQRAHYRMPWEERLTRNACGCKAEQITITLFGVPAHFAIFLGLPAQMEH